MPLHLLGKKSWNVYSPANIARVRHDEAKAKADEEEAERRMQEVDAERRIKILRGDRPPTPPHPPPSSHVSSEPSARPDRVSRNGAERCRKRRRLAGEDDTDRDIRLAREDAAYAEIKRDELALRSHRDDRKAPVSLLDNTGHVNLFQDEGGSRKAEKNREAEAEAEKRRREFEDQYTMRFSNASGFKEQVGRQPWYSSSNQTAEAPDAMPAKNVWGNEDPMRQEREKARMDANDPLAAMKRGIRQLKATEQERKRWNEEKRMELETLKAEERTGSGRPRRKRSSSIDSFEHFKLDQPESEDRHERNHRSSSRRRLEHRHRLGRTRDRSRDHSHKRTKRTHHSLKGRAYPHHGDEALN